MIIHELLVEGGGERQCISLARALTRQGHTVTLYTCAYDRAHCFPDIYGGIKVEDVGRGLFPRLLWPKVLRGYLDMRRLEKTISEPHEIWNPHHWPAEWGAVRLKRKLGGMVVWTCNDVPDFYPRAKGNYGLLKRLIYRLEYFYDRAQTRKIDLSVFLSRWAESEFKAIYPANTHVVRSGADPDRFRPGGDREKIRNRFGYQQEDFVLLWLGIFMPHRRLQDAIRAVALLKSRRRRVKLLLAGSGSSFPEYFASLQALSNELGLQTEVTFSGKVADEEIRDFYCASDAFLFPNETQTWGLAVLEAMACGRPVIVSRGAAVHEVLTDLEDAVLFPARDPDALASKVELLMAQPELRTRVAQNGMSLIRTEYNWERFAERMAEVFKEVAEPSQPASFDGAKEQAFRT